MRFFKWLAEKVMGLNWFSKLAVKIGALTMLSFYITGATARIIAMYVPNYFGAITVFRGCMEAAPASLAACICAAVICDIAMRDRNT